MDIKKGDQVKIISGRDRSKSGNVLKVFPDESRVTVDGLNVYQKKVRPKRQGQKGETVLVPRPLFSSKVMLICKNCKKTTRIGHRKEGNQKVRYCRRCQAKI